GFYLIYFPHAAQSATSSSSHLPSSSSNVFSSLLSASSTPTTSPPSKMGTTISDRERLLQAICPGNASTSGTISVRPCCQLDPQTPFPFRIRVHATGPWKGPTTSSPSFTR